MSRVSMTEICDSESLNNEDEYSFMWMSKHYICDNWTTMAEVQK